MTKNGQLAADQLVTVEEQHLSPATATAYVRLRAAAHLAGHQIAIWEPAGGYRSAATQQDMRDRPWLYNIKSGVKVAAAGQSTHGQGRAVDIKGGSALARNWVAENAARFGFRHPNPVTDPDHYEHGDNTVTVTDPTPAQPPVTIPLEGLDMDYIYNFDDKVWWLGCPAVGYLFYIGTDETWKGIAYLQYGPSKDYTRGQFKAYADECNRRAAELKALYSAPARSSTALESQVAALAAQVQQLSGALSNLPAAVDAYQKQAGH